MRKALFLLVLILILASAFIPAVSAIPIFYGSFFETQGMWTRLLDANINLFVSGADFQHSPWEAEDVHQLADHGIKINFRTFWWWQFYNGEIAWNTSVVDFYYNASLLKLLEQYIDWEFTYLNPEKIWAVTLSEEEPGHSFLHFDQSIEALQKYNDTYHSETGFWLRRDKLYNEREWAVLNDWQSEKFVWVFNHLYDYIKGKWPHLLVFQFAGLWPGGAPVWVGGIDITDLKADAYMGDGYFYEAYDNPFSLYEPIRQYKSTFPDKEYHFWLWGEEAWSEAGLAGGFEHIRRNAWLAYLAGVDAIGWFNWHYIHGNIWRREDTLGKRLFMYTNRLNEELSKLPLFKPRPQVLIIRDQMMSFQVGLCCDLGLFNEWDVVNQRTFAKKEMDLSQYKLIVVNEDRYYNEVVEKLNEYVKSGGNLIMLGGFGWEQTNIHDDEPRTSKFLIEEGVRQEHVWGDIIINVSKPNLLGLNLQYEYVDSSMLAISKNTLSENHRSIGEFHLVDGQGSPIQMEYCPLVLYHNSSNPEEGSILYWGVISGPVPPLGFPDVQYEDVVEVCCPEWNYTRFLYRNATRAFARNYLHINGSLAEKGTENMIITQSEIEEGVILAGVSNYYPQTVNLNYTLDLDNFDLPEGEYWVHSLDENLTLGLFESQKSLLEVPLGVVANGTRLLLISQQELDPSYSVNIFPDIPTAEEAEDLWSWEIPSASFTFSPPDPSMEDVITFADTSTDVDGTIVSWYWEFGDGETSIEQNPTHRYIDKGQYTVRMTVTDNSDWTNTTELIVTIRNLPPTASFTYSPTDLIEGQDVNFMDASSDPEGRLITSWHWDFGDGYTSDVNHPWHRFHSSGSYTVTLTVKDDEGLEGSYFLTVDVKPDYTVYLAIGGLAVVIVAAFTAIVIVRRRKLS